MKKKTIVINEDLHQKIKVFCAVNNLKLNDFIEKQLEKMMRDYVNNERN
jgi:hypothetical protein